MSIDGLIAQDFVGTRNVVDHEYGDVEPSVDQLFVVLKKLIPTLSEAVDAYLAQQIKKKKARR